MTLSRVEFLSRLKHYREEDRHECNLINARMSWLINGQSFLIGAYVIAANNSDIWFRVGITVCLLVIAEYFARKLSKAISQADSVIDEWHVKEARLQEEVKSVQDIELRKEMESYFVGRQWQKALGEKEDERHRESFAFQRNIYWIFLFIWIALLVMCLVLNGRALVIKNAEPRAAPNPALKAGLGR
ncbi:MAG: hypothetical protein ACK449_03810 [Planctomycetota bacterium]|jgi:hypothetical protein